MDNELSEEDKKTLDRISKLSLSDLLDELLRFASSWVEEREPNLTYTQIIDAYRNRLTTYHDSSLKDNGQKT